MYTKKIKIRGDVLPRKFWKYEEIVVFLRDLSDKGSVTYREIRKNKGPSQYSIEKYFGGLGEARRVLDLNFEDGRGNGFTSRR